MKIVIVDKKNATLKVENKILKINEQKIPLRLIDTLIIASSHHVETKDLTKITNENISIILLSYNNIDSSIITNTKSKNAELKLAQYNALKHSLTIAKYILTHKISFHASHLQKHDIKLDLESTKQKIDKADDLQTLLGIEGSFSKIYFSNYFKLFPKSLHHSKRSKNPPLDPLNATMSFLYMIFYNLISIRLLSFGFELSIGYLHTPFRSHNALASDLIEFIRADINAFVYELFANQKLTKSDFSKKGGVYLRYEARKNLWGDIKIFIDRQNPKIDTHIANIRAML